VLAHFRWEEFYPLVAARPERLAREFAAYMAEDLGLRPCRTDSWADLLTNPSRREDFLPQWTQVVAYFRAMGAVTVTRKTSLGLEVRNPLPWLRLFYLKPMARLDESTTALPGPPIRAAVFLDLADPKREVFREPGRFLDGTSFPVYSRPMAQEGTEWDPTLVGCREYLAPLDAVLSADPDVIRRQLLEFARIAFDDVERQTTGVVTRRGPFPARDASAPARSGRRPAPRR
jgi:hypothetical protein